MKRSSMLGMLSVLAVGLVFTLPTSEVGADMPPPFTCHTDQLPSPCATYVSGDQEFITSFMGGYVRIKTINHGDFAGMVPGSRPPTELWDTQDEYFTSDVQFDLSIDGEAFAPIEVLDVPVHTWIELFEINGSTRSFNAELVALDIDLGSGILMRIDPYELSGGQTDVTDLGGGLWGISSFFDVFMELSIDNGVVWNDADGAHPLVGVPAPGAMYMTFRSGTLRASL